MKSCWHHQPWRQRQWEHLYDEPRSRQACQSWPRWRYGQLRRLPEKGVIAGVCAGVAAHLQVAPNGLRALWVIAAIATGFLPMLALYVVLTIVLPRGYAENALGGPTPPSRRQKRDLADQFKDIDERTRRLESYVISSEYEWERKYRDLR